MPFLFIAYDSSSNAIAYSSPTDTANQVYAFTTNCTLPCRTCTTNLTSCLSCYSSIPTIP